MNITIAKDLAELSSKAAAKLFRIANDSILERGRFTIALSGGSTPRALYGVMSQASIQWNKWHFFFGDERNVAPDDEESNLRMANESLLGTIPAADRNVYAWGTGTGEPAEIAATYADRVRTFFSPEEPRFDLVLLGMGADGHTASLFPGNAALVETERIAVETWVPQMNAWRYTLTLPVINSARNVMFLAAGREKAETLRDVIAGEPGPEPLPAQAVRPADGELCWFVDEAAAALLPED